MQPSTQYDLYEAPVLTRIGSLEQVTMGTSSGPKTDKAFPTDTPRGNLTFS